MAIYWLIQALIAYVASLIFVALAIDDYTHFGWLAPLLLTLGIISLQWIFLLPIRKPTPDLKPVPLFLSMAVGGLYVGILIAAFVLALTFTLSEYSLFGIDIEEMPILLILLSIIGTAWLVSTPLLIVFCRKNRDPGIIQRVASGLFLGTILEAGAIIPLDILVRRREDCICGTGTFYALVACGTVGFAVFGPAIFLPLTLPHRKRWYGRLCDVCGYNMRGNTGAERCPECGAGWRKPKQQKLTPSSDE